MTESMHPIFADRQPVFGMVHLLPLPGAPGYRGSRAEIRSFAQRDAQALAAGGVDAIMLENFGDTPFFPGRVPATVVAHMTAVAMGIRRAVDLPLGINVLRNDGVSALGVAHACSADFIRVNVLTGARLTDQGIVSGIAHDLLRERARLGAESIRIFADVSVKHSAPLAPYDFAAEIEDTLHRGGADALVVSGTGTGKPTELGDLERARAAAGNAPILVGSGVTPDTVAAFRERASGFIVGTAFKRGGLAHEPVDVERVRALMERLA